MLERLVEQCNAVTLVLADVPSIKNLTAQQWATAADLIVTLRPFMDVTEMLCGASYPTLSMILPVLESLQHLLQSTNGGLDMLRDVLLHLLKEKFGDVFTDDELCSSTPASSASHAMATIGWRCQATLQLHWINIAYTLCLKKNTPDIFNSSRHCWILIIFGTSV